MTPTTTMVKYDAACRALAAASKVDEAKSIRDKAEAVRVYAKQAKNFNLERQAIEIRLRAERRTGELLIETKANGQRHDGRGNNPGTKKLEPPTVTPTQKLESPVVTPTLTDLGISKRQSADWQKMAEIPAEEFEAKLTTVSETHGKATTAAILRGSKDKNPPVPDWRIKAFGPECKQRHEKISKQLLQHIEASFDDFEGVSWAPGPESEADRKLCKPTEDRYRITLYLSAEQMLNLQRPDGKDCFGKTKSSTGDAV